MQEQLKKARFKESRIPLHRLHRLHGRALKRRIAFIKRHFWALGRCMVSLHKGSHLEDRHCLTRSGGQNLRHWRRPSRPRHVRQLARKRHNGRLGK